MNALTPVITMRQAGYAGGPGGSPLAPLDLTLLPGEAVAILGSPNSGASTLYALLTGLLAPTSGELRRAPGEPVLVSAPARPEAAALCGRVLVLRHSRLVYDGPVPPSGLVCELVVRGQLDPSRSAWFGGLSITPGEGGTTRIHGPLPDPAALYGLVARARDLGLELVSFQQRPASPAEVLRAWMGEA